MAETAGILLPFFGTALGAAAVFFLRGTANAAGNRALSGVAAGIMVAACVFSLLLPALAQGGLGQTALGFLPGALFLFAADRSAGKLRLRRFSRTEKTALAVTVHNLPEGMAVGAALAAWRMSGQEAALGGALALALGIAVQNVPEGAVVSLPMAAEGMPRCRAFLWGVLSGAVEPAGALLILLTAGRFANLLPCLLSFAAGAMFSVVVEELVPEMAAGDQRSPAGLWFALGFVGMMALDVALG